MRRLPIYFLIDISESMVGAPIRQVEEGMRTIIQNLRTDPYALETVYVAIIGFAGKSVELSPLTELYKFYPPVFPIGGGTSLGAGLEALMDDIDRNVKRNTPDSKGDWKPLVFLFTDGNPTDDYNKAFRRWNDHYRRRCNLVAVSLGDNMNTLTLAQLTENVLILKQTDKESFNRFFKWISDSVSSTSQAVSDSTGEEIKLADTNGINLEKADSTAPRKVDENFVVLHGRCQTTKDEYLIKFGAADYMREEGDTREMPRGMRYRLIGAYPVDAAKYAALSLPTTNRVNVNQLYGNPACPCCGNQYAIVVCECGKIFCVGESSSVKCPWCGMEGELGDVGEGGRDIARGNG